MLIMARPRLGMRTPTHDVLAWNPLADRVDGRLRRGAGAGGQHRPFAVHRPAPAGCIPSGSGSLVLWSRTCGWRRRASPTTRASPSSSVIFDQGRALPPVVGRHHVAVKRRGTRRYNHPVVGEITLDWDALTSDAEPDQQLVSTRRSRAPAPSRRFASSRPGCGAHQHVSLTYRPRRTTPSDASVPDVWCSLTVPLCAATPAVARRSPCK
jgi:hypothetical protein